MDDKKTEFNYPLLVPFEIAKSGEQVNATFITLKAPTSKVMSECAALKQAFFRSMQEQQTQTDGSTEQDVGEIQGHDIIFLIAMSSTVDMPDVMNVAKKLFMAPGIALVEGEIKLGQALIDKMDAEDFESMLGEYLVNFILASSLKKLSNKSIQQ